MPITVCPAPAAVIGSRVAEGIPVVCAAHSSGATQATRHLLELGHRRIAVIGGPRGWVATEERMRGHHAALAGAGVLPDPALVRYADFRIEGGREAAARLLARPDPPTAIFAFNDGMAAGARSTGESTPLTGSRAASPWEPELAVLLAEHGRAVMEERLIAMLLSDLAQ